LPVCRIVVAAPSQEKIQTFFKLSTRRTAISSSERCWAPSALTPAESPQATTATPRSFFRSVAVRAMKANACPMALCLCWPSICLGGDLFLLDRFKLLME